MLFSDEMMSWSGGASAASVVSLLSAVDVSAVVSTLADDAVADGGSRVLRVSRTSPSALASAEAVSVSPVSRAENSEAISLAMLRGSVAQGRRSEACSIDRSHDGVADQLTDVDLSLGGALSPAAVPAV